MAAASSASTPLDVADVFSTDIWTGTGATKTITNGVDLLNNGGLTWIKSRSDAADHSLYDTVRGTTKDIVSNSTSAETTQATGLTAFNNNGFTIGTLAKLNTLSSTYVGWTFRQAPKFFDVVTYTGDGSLSTQVSHGLAVTPKIIIAKKLNNTSNWGVNFIAPDYDINNHVGFTLNATSVDRNVSNGLTWVTSTTFKPSYLADSDSSLNTYNVLGDSYVAYLFAHDDSADGIIRCGSYVGNGSTTGPTVTLGWEPQFLLIKNADAVGDWALFDNIRDTVNPRTAYLEANTSDTEGTGRDVDFTATGFQIKSTDASVNTNTNNYIYMAIRAEGV